MNDNSFKNVKGLFYEKSQITNLSNLSVQLKCLEICKNKWTKFDLGVDLFDHKGLEFHQTVKPHYLINAPA